MATIKLTSHYGGSITYCAAHIEAHRPNLVGRITEEPGTAPCPDCVAARHRDEAPDVMRAALQSPEFAHTRAGNRLMRDTVLCYHRDPVSPTGVRLACALDAGRFDVVYRELLAAGKITSTRSPLSPTEGR
jgi:hypothetical protein